MEEMMKCSSYKNEIRYKSNKYRVSYQEDFFTTIEEIEIVCSKNDIKRLVDEYYEKNKERLKNTVGVNWEIIDQ